jgi:hypothetical protein
MPAAKVRLHIRPSLPDGKGPFLVPAYRDGSSERHHRRPPSVEDGCNWVHSFPGHRAGRIRAVKDGRAPGVHQETGIAIQRPPVPETLFSSLDPPAQLDLLRRVLQEGGPSPDVLGIDVIWPGILADYLIDLRPYFGTELSSQDPQLVSSYTVHGKLVAVPYHTQRWHSRVSNRTPPAVRV